MQSTGERFLSKVSVPYDLSQCWEWKGATNNHGMPLLRSKNTHVRANRVAWLIFKGEDPGESLVIRTCGNKLCVNPKHLTLGDKKTLSDVNAGFDKGIRKKNLSRKLTFQEVQEVRRLKAEDEKLTHESLAIKFGIS